MATSFHGTPHYYMASSLGEALFSGTKFSISLRLVILWKCQGGDSNPYGFLHQILSLARLPIPPPRQIAMLTKLAVLGAAGKFG
jgi:hypothetical protein